MDLLEKINNLPENLRGYLCSNDSRIDLERACFFYDVKDEDIDKIILPITDIIIKDIPLDQLPMKIQAAFQVRNDIANGIACELSKKSFCPFSDYFKNAQELLKQWEQNKIPPIVTEEKVQRRILDIEPWIIEQEKEEKKQEEKAAQKIISMDLNMALEKYPNIGEQSVTVNPLKLRYFPTSVRPSIKNWITDFHDNMGAGKHSAMDRSNYLFHGDNGKKITPIERQKLAFILKSLEEKTPIKIDPEKQTVIFENNEQSEVAKQQTMVNMRKEMDERSEDLKTSAAIEQKDVFQRYVPQAIKKPQTSPSMDFKNEKKEQSSIKDENYFKNVGQKTNSGKDNYFNDFASIKDKNNSDQKAALVSGSISFSSAQKLPAEQAVNAAKTEEIKSIVQKTNAQSVPPKQFQQHSQWQMKPKSYKDNETEFVELREEAKNTGNIVDLRN